MSKTATTANSEALSLEVYHGRRLKKVATIGTTAGGFSLLNLLRELFISNPPCTKLAVIQSPQESTVIKPNEMLPLLSGFEKPFSLEIFKDKNDQIQFQIAFCEDDADSIVNLRALFGSHLNIDTMNIESWNISSGLSDKCHLDYLLPSGSLYPLSFALNWKDADIVTLLLEKLKTFQHESCLIQLLVHPQPNSGLQISTDILASLNYMRRVETFRLNLIKQRFNEPIAKFALRILAQDQQTVTAIKRTLIVLNAPFNRFKEVCLTGKKAEKVAQAVLDRKRCLTDGLSLISMPELAGLWHLDLEPDFTINRARIREVATARIDNTTEAGRTLGFHTLRGKTYPVILPYSARNNHSCVFGKSQSGKSTALIRISTQDIQSGLGVAFVDQHDLPLRVLPHIPRERWDDVILISPRMLQQSGYMFPLNLFNLGHKGAFAIEFICETLKEILGRAFTAESIGPRTSYILDIATTALLKDQNCTSHTVLDLAHVLLDKQFRYKLADGLNDEDTKEKLLGFDRLPKDAFAAPLNKLQLFSRDSIRPMLEAKENGFNTFRGSHKSFLDAKPIVICDLADIPHASAVVIGSIVLAMLQLEAFKRNPQEENELFNCYVDEAAAFLSMENADLITRTFQECAKFRMSLSLINQSYDTIPSTVRKTLSTNVSALMYFSMGIGSGDARIAKAELHNEFTEEELNALPVGRAAVRINSEVFSVYSPDFKTPENNHTEELTDYALRKHCTEIHRTKSGKTTNTPHTAESSAVKTTPQITSKTTATRKKVDLSKLQGKTKQQAIIKMLNLSGLVSLTDLTEIFFSDSSAYGRQFLKKMAKEKLINHLKLGKRLAYYPNIKGGTNKNGQGNSQPFILPDERLWEHSTMTGSIGARFCKLAAKRGVKLNMERETNWETNGNQLRPDLLVRWNEQARSHLFFIEADRATESVATFKKEKLNTYSKALENFKGKEIVRLIIVVPDQNRLEKLSKAVSEYPKLARLVRLTILNNWTTQTDIFEDKIFHCTLNNELLSV